MTENMWNLIYTITVAVCFLSVIGICAVDWIKYEINLRK